MLEIDGIPQENLINSSQYICELTKFRVGISVGGSAPVSETSLDKSEMEKNVRMALSGLASEGGTLVNGGMGQNGSLMRIAVKAYFKAGGHQYIAIIPKTYLKYELEPFNNIRREYGSRVRLAVVHTDHQRELLFKMIAEQAKNPSFIVSGAGLGTLKELCIFLRDRKPHQTFHILNHTQYAQKLIELMNRLGLNEGQDFQVRR